MELDIKIVYEGEKTLRKFRYILAKTGIELGRDDHGEDCVRGWNGWIRVRKKTTLIANACIICFLSNMEYILSRKEGTLIEIYLTSNSF